MQNTQSSRRKVVRGFASFVLGIRSELTQTLPHILAVAVPGYWEGGDGGACWGQGRGSDVLAEVDGMVDGLGFGFVHFEDLVDGQFKGVVQHSGDEHFQERAGGLDAGVCVDFDQPDFQAAVYEEVVTEYLKTVFSAVGVDFCSD